MRGPGEGTRVQLQEELPGDQVHVPAQDVPDLASLGAQTRFLDRAVDTAQGGAAAGTQEPEVPVPQGLGHHQTVVLEAQAQLAEGRRSNPGGRGPGHVQLGPVGRLLIPPRSVVPVRIRAHGGPKPGLQAPTRQLQAPSEPELDAGPAEVLRRVALIRELIAPERHLPGRLPRVDPFRGKRHGFLAEGEDGDQKRYPATYQQSSPGGVCMWVDGNPDSPGPSKWRPPGGLLFLNRIWSILRLKRR